MQNQFLPAENIESTVETTPSVAPSVTSEASETAVSLAASQAATEALTQIQRKVCRRKNRFWIMFVLLEASFLFPAFWTLLHIGSQNPPPTGNSVLLLLLPTLLAMGTMFLLMFLPSDLDAETLTRLGGTKAIPTLLDSLTGNSSSRHRKSVLRALTALLPQMQASDAHLLTPIHRYTLNVFLRQSRLPSWLAGAEASFAVAILKAYEQIGDAKAIPVVEHLANSRPRSERQRAVKQAAQECLPLLQVHISGLDTTQTLLRASMPETNTPETLLRAATATTNTNPQDLLRATTPTDTPNS